MIFELDKEYIVTVTDKGIIPIEEFNKERFYDRDNDDLNFLTDKEKEIVVNDVLTKIRAEMEKQAYPITYFAGIGLPLFVILKIIDKYKEKGGE